jgi:hypothetical protein
MKKIVLTESQFDMVTENQLLNESSERRSYDIMSKVNGLKTGKPTLNRSGASSVADQIYDAIKGAGTDEDAIKSALSQCQNMHDVKAVINSFKQNTGEDLYSWLKGDLGTEYQWNFYVLRPLRDALQTSNTEKHFEVDENAEQNTADEKPFLEKFPCLKDEKGYTFRRVKNGVLYFQNDANVGIKDYGIKMDGTMYYYKDSKWNQAPEKASCQSADYQDIQEALNYGGIPSDSNTEGSTEPKPESGETTKPEGGETTKPEGEETTKPVVRTQLMTGSDVKEIQEILHKNGFGEIVGAVDGKLGKRTLAGIKEFFLGATRPKVEAITMKPKEVKMVDPKIETPKLMSTGATSLAESVKHFKKLIK